jgi:hypothetical protein
MIAKLSVLQIDPNRWVCWALTRHFGSPARCIRAQVDVINPEKGPSIVSEHATPENAIASWFADRTQLDRRDACDLIAYLFETGWTFRRIDEVAIDRADAESVAQQPDHTSLSRVRAALDEQASEPAPLSAEESIQAAHARWLSPHLHRDVPARLVTTAGEHEVTVRLDEEDCVAWAPAIADPDERAPHSYLFRFPVQINTDSDTLGAIQILGSKLVDAGYRYEIVNDPGSGTA